MKDADIVEMYWQRNESAIKETTKKYSAYLSKIANNILFNPEDTKECVNDTYLAAWNSMPENKPSVLSTYLGKIARHISIDLYRRKIGRKDMLLSMLYHFQSLKIALPAMILWKKYLTVSYLKKQSIPSFMRFLLMLEKYLSEDTISLIRLNQYPITAESVSLA